MLYCIFSLNCTFNNVDKMKRMKRVIFIMLITLTIIGCGDDNTVNPGNPVTLSDLTRSGKFISFTSNRDNPTKYDVFLAQVDANGNLATTGLVYPANPFNLTASLTSREQNKQSNWSPDGRVLFFTSVQSNNEEIYAFFFKADGSIDSTVSPNPKKQFSSNGNWDNNPSFSPDGKYIIFDRRWNNNGGGLDSTDSRDLFIGDVAGSGNTFNISDVRALTNTNGPDEFNPKWSPKISVRRVAYEYKGSSTSSDHDVFVIDPLDTVNNQNFYNPNNSGYPAWSPACERIIFESDKTSGDYWKIVGLPYPASGTPSDVINEAGINSRYPTWLPNGNYLAYIRMPSAGIGHIYVATTSGQDPRKLLPASFDNANSLWPAW